VGRIALESFNSLQRARMVSLEKVTGLCAWANSTPVVGCYGSRTKVRLWNKLENTATGFESNQRILDAIEEHAIKIVRRFYERLGYKVEDKHRTRPYDFECAKDGQRLRYIEVKGTRTSGDQVLLTPNEVKLPDRKNTSVDLCVLHSIKLADERTAKCSGGTLVRYEKWHPRDYEVRPVSFICELTKSNG
jgi:hypothetical protein